jgi:hypothetical protein
MTIRKSLETKERERMERKRLHHLDDLITHAFAAHQIPDTPTAQWCKREALRWPWKMSDQLAIYSARMLYEAAAWGERINEEQRKVRDFNRQCKTIF